MNKKIFVLLSVIIIITGCVKTPSNLKISKVETNKVKLEWDKTDYAKKYEIYRSKFGKNEFSKYWETTGNSFEDIGLYEGSEYSYKIKAVSMFLTGNSQETTTVSAVTKINAPKNLIAESIPNSETSVQLNWDSLDKATSYKIFRSNDVNGEYKEVGSTEKTNFLDKTISPASIYFYVVKAFNKNTESNFGNKVKYKSELLEPQRATFVTKPNGINLLWEGNRAADFYTVYRSVGEGFVKIAEVSGKTFEDTTLTGGDKITYMIKSNKGMLQSRDGILVNVIIALKAPNDLNISINEQGEVALKWGSVENVEYYKIYRSVDNKYFEVAGFSNENKFEDSGLKSDRTYFYKVKSCRNDMESEFSTTKQILAK